MEKEGLLIKAISGFYYVRCEETDSFYECKAKGIFRNEKRSPLVGDRVIIDSIDEAASTAIVFDILPRKNELTRPPMANLDCLVLVISVASPAPSLQVVDKLITVCEYKEVEPVLVFTKSDLGDPEPYAAAYREAGFKVICLSNEEREEESLNAVKDALRGKISAFAGNTGAGKSTLLNRIAPELSLETAQISKKLGRGRHTTRHVELFALPELSCFVADTPGFGTMELLQYEVIRKDKLQYCFREFEEYLENCRFTGCSHTVEKGCAVLAALEEGRIAKSRHESYTAMYTEAAKLKEWELR